MNTLPKDLKVHVVSHTHWDREWRQPFEFFQPYLVKCLDQLFEIFKNDPSYKAFLLDGQFVMIEDYLEAKPQRAEHIKHLVKQGKLFIGPWYSLIDNNLVDGESILRNLLYGIRLSKKYGGYMKEGYLISSFGHCSQMPQIFAGFGISSILFSRGISQWQTRSELLWESPDGTQALGLHLPDRYTKSNWFYLVHRPGCVGRDAMDWKYRWNQHEPMHACDAESANHYWWRTRETFLKDPENWIECVKHLIENALSTSEIPILLAMDGVDHLFPHKDVPKIIQTANEHFGKKVLVHSTLPAYIRDVRSYLKRKKITLEIKKGEMRRPMKVPGFNQLLPGTVSSRMRMKLLNHEAETALIRAAEPLCTLAWMHGSEYPAPFIEKAWKLLMKNHAHDGICGTSADPVHNAMADRYIRARNLADFLTYEALKEVVVKIDTSSLKEKELALTVFNTTGFSRSPVINAVVDIPYEWNAKGMVICNINRKPIPFLPKTTQKQEREILADHEAQLGFLCLRIELDFLAENLPAFGYKTFIVKPGGWHQKTASKNAKDVFASGSATIENQYVKLEANPDGSLCLTDKKSGNIYSNLNVFSSSGDIGDSTMFTPPMSDFTVLSTGFDASIEIIEQGPLSASLRITKKMQIPAYCEPKAKLVELVETAQPFKAHRSKETVEEIISSAITLEMNSPLVKIKTTVQNRARDHRLRALFPSSAKNAKTWVADSPFAMVKRNITLPDTRDWAEPWSPTQPIRSWFCVSDDTRGLTVFTKGIPEAACIDDKQRTLALTLLRCTRRSIGEDYAQEGPQCLGAYTFEYAILAFQGDPVKQGFPEKAADFLSPVRAILSSSGREGTLPLHQEYFSLEVKPSWAAGNLSISSVKKAEDRNGVILRLYNPTPKKINAGIKALEKLENPIAVMLDEKKIKGETGKNSIDLEPFKIHTLFLGLPGKRKENTKRKKKK